MSELFGIYFLAPNGPYSAFFVNIVEKTKKNKRKKINFTNLQ